MLYRQLTAMHPDMDILTSYHKLLHILAAAGFTDHLSMCILGDIVGG